jgi:YD repeat-containing protein
VEADRVTGASRTIEYSYDGRGLQVSELIDGLFRTDYAYDASSNLTSTTGPLTSSDGTRFTETRTYDGLGRVVTVLDRAGYTTTLEYDPAGHVIASTDGRGVRTRSDFTPAGFLGASYQPTGPPQSSASEVSTSYTYDDGGNMLRMVDPRGAAFASTFTYDAQGRQTSHTSVISASETAVEKWTFDANGNVTSYRDPLGRVTSTTYDAQNRVTRIESPGGTATSPKTLVQIFEHDADGNIVRNVGVGGSGYVTISSFDKLARLVSVTDADGQTAVFTYDRWGNVLTETYPTSSSSYTYDSLNRRLTSVDGVGATTTYEYPGTSSTVTMTDALGRKTKEVYGTCRPRTRWAV